MKAVYFGYDVFGNLLRKMLDGGVAISRIYTLEEDDYYNKSQIVTRIAQENEIEIKKCRPNLDELKSFVNDNSIEYFFAAAIPYKIPLVGGVRGINFHPSYLPFGRGAWPLPAFKMSRPDEFGVSMHELTDDIDKGPVLLRERLKVGEDDVYESMIVKAQFGFERLFENFHNDPDGVWAARFEQEGGSDIPFPTDKEQTLDWGISVAVIKQILQAYGRNEVSAFWHDRRWLVEWASVFPYKHGREPGAVLSEFHGNVVVAAKDGVVVLHSFREEK